MVLLIALLFGSPVSFSADFHKPLVAVVDTGVDVYHPSLKGCFWADAQGNRGWDFVNNGPNLVDEHGHGTHIAGIIESVSQNSAVLMPLRYYSASASGSVNLAKTILALGYAIDHGAQIINYSAGGPIYSKEEFEVLKRAEQKGILVIVAAGNDHRNTDIEDNHYYPASYELNGLTNIISVASLDAKNQLLETSNWGLKSVDVAAPGGNIFSTLPGGRFGYLSGTSQAAAFVSGIAAKLLARSPGLTYLQLKALIISHVTHLPALRGRVNTGGKVDALSAR